MGLAGSLLALVDWLETGAGCKSAVLSPSQPTQSPSLMETPWFVVRDRINRKLSAHRESAGSNSLCAAPPQRLAGKTVQAGVCRRAEQLYQQFDHSIIWRRSGERCGRNCCGRRIPESPVTSRTNPRRADWFRPRRSRSRSHVARQPIRLDLNDTPNGQTPPRPEPSYGSAYAAAGL